MPVAHGIASTKDQGVGLAAQVRGVRAAGRGKVWTERVC